jgi:hypothetical protein
VTGDKNSFPFLPVFLSPAHPKALYHFSSKNTAPGGVVSGHEGKWAKDIVI